MASSVKRGNQYEKEVREILTAWGYKAEGQHRKVGWIRDRYTNQLKMIMMGRDVFGSDIIAKRVGYCTHWVQVGTQANAYAKRAQIKNEPWNLDHDNVQVWLRQPKKRRFRVFELNHDGTWTEWAHEVDYNTEVKRNVTKSA